MHLCKQQEIDFDQLLKQAEANFEQDMMIIRSGEEAISEVKLAEMQELVGQIYAESGTPVPEKRNVLAVVLSGGVVDSIISNCAEIFKGVEVLVIDKDLSDFDEEEDHLAIVEAADPNDAEDYPYNAFIRGDEVLESRMNLEKLVDWLNSAE